MADEVNQMFNNTIQVNSSVITVQVQNNAITISLELTFQSSNISNATISELCQALNGKLETVSDRKFQCVIPSGTTYTPGTKTTMNLLSDPLNDVVNTPVPVVGGATSLTNSIMLIGFSYTFHFLFKNL